MKYAVIALQGQQYKIKEGEELTVDKVHDKPEYEVLMLRNGDKLEIGTPHLSKTLVKLSVKEPEVKGDKITVQQFRAKSRYRRKMGFRPLQTLLTVEKIG